MVEKFSEFIRDIITSSSLTQRHINSALKQLLADVATFQDQLEETLILNILRHIFKFAKTATLKVSVKANAKTRTLYITISTPVFQNLQQLNEYWSLFAIFTALAYFIADDVQICEKGMCIGFRCKPYETLQTSVFKPLQFFSFTIPERHGVEEGFGSESSLLIVFKSMEICRDIAFTLLGQHSNSIIKNVLVALPNNYNSSIEVGVEYVNEKGVKYSYTISRQNMALVHSKGLQFSEVLIKEAKEMLKLSEKWIALSKTITPPQDVIDMYKDLVFIDKAEKAYINVIFNVKELEGKPILYPVKGSIKCDGVLNCGVVKDNIYGLSYIVSSNFLTDIFCKRFVKSSWNEWLRREIALFIANEVFSFLKEDHDYRYQLPILLPAVEPCCDSFVHSLVWQSEDGYSIRELLEGKDLILDSTNKFCKASVSILPSKIFYEFVTVKRERVVNSIEANYIFKLLNEYLMMYGEEAAKFIQYFDFYSITRLLGQFKDLYAILINSLQSNSEAYAKFIEMVLYDKVERILWKLIEFDEEAFLKSLPVRTLSKAIRPLSRVYLIPKDKLVKVLKDQYNMDEETIRKITNNYADMLIDDSNPDVFRLLRELLIRLRRYSIEGRLLLKELEGDLIEVNKIVNLMITEMKSSL